MVYKNKRMRMWTIKGWWVINACAGNSHEKLFAHLDACPHRSAPTKRCLFWNERWSWMRLCAIDRSIAFLQCKSKPESYVTQPFWLNGDIVLLEQSCACVHKGFRGFPHDTQQGHVHWHCGYRPLKHASTHTRTWCTKNNIWISIKKK